MRLLLDTHTFLWLVEGNVNLSATAAAALANNSNDLYLSVASIWELAIKTGNKKLALTDPLDVFVAKWTHTYHLEHLPIQSPHALALLALPDVHKDPFDRILIAQAAAERMHLVSGDAKIASYGGAIVW